MIKHREELSDFLPFGKPYVQDFMKVLTCLYSHSSAVQFNLELFEYRCLLTIFSCIVWVNNPLLLSKYISRGVLSHRCLHYVVGLRCHCKGV